MQKIFMLIKFLEVNVNGMEIEMDYYLKNIQILKYMLKQVFIAVSFIRKLN